jgi:hypothetical protein
MRRLLLLSVVLSLSACGAKKSEGEAVAQREARAILESTPWLDQLPVDDKTPFNIYLFGGGGGVVVAGNVNKGSYEMFDYLGDDGSLRMRFLDEGKSYDLTYSIRRFSGQDFDYKLELDKSPRGPHVYYGFDSDQRVPDVVKRTVRAHQLR